MRDGDQTDKDFTVERGIGNNIWAIPNASFVWLYLA